MDLDTEWKKHGEEGNMRECIKAYLKYKGQTMYIQELMEALRPYFTVDGDFTWQSRERKNIIFWVSMDEKLIETVTDMLNNKEIYAAQMGKPETFMMMHLMTSGNLLRMPIAKNLEHDYKTPHWSPVLLSCKPVTKN